jgi:hypothetical protein
MSGHGRGGPPNRGKFASMRVSGDDGGRGRGGRGKKILNRKPLNGNFIAQRQHGDAAQAASAQASSAGC